MQSSDKNKKNQKISRKDKPLKLNKRESALFCCILAFKESDMSSFKEFLIKEMCLCELDAAALDVGGKFIEGRDHISWSNLATIARVYTEDRRANKTKVDEDYLDDFSLEW